MMNCSEEPRFISGWNNTWLEFAYLSVKLKITIVPFP